MHHLELKLLRSFAAIAEELSVTRAAEKLNLTQPTVSGQIKELEQTLGFLLFHRTSRSVRLSEQGEQLLPLVRTLLSQAEEVRLTAEAMQASAKTHFRLGAAMYTLDFEDRTALLEAFEAACPNLSYTIDNRLQSDQVRDLLSDQLDASLLLGIATDIPPARFTADHATSAIVNEIQHPAALDRIVLRRRKIGLLVPESSALAKHVAIPRGALKGEKIAMLSLEHGQQVIDSLMAFIDSAGAQAVWHTEGNALAIERQALRDGTCAIGIGWFPVLPGFVWREAEGLDACLEFAVVLGTNANPASRQFFEFSRNWQDARAQAEVPVSAD